MRDAREEAIAALMDIAAARQTGSHRLMFLHDHPTWHRFGAARQLMVEAYRVVSEGFVEVHNYAAAASLLHDGWTPEDSNAR